MRIRLQYSLLTLLILTTACAVVIVYVIVPWRYRVRQEEIWTRLSSKTNLKFYQTSEGESNSYTIDIFRDKDLVRFLIENMEDCERITAISLYGDTFSDEDLQQLARLKNLRRIDLHDCPLSQKRMQILSKMPLTSLNLQDLTYQDFKSLVLPRTLKSLYLQSVNDPYHGLAEPTWYPRPQTLSIEQLPELEDLTVHQYRVSKQKTTINLRDLPRLKRLTLMVDHPASESRIGSLPSIEELNVSHGFWPQLRHNSLSQLKKLSLVNPVMPFELNDLEKILVLPKLEELQLGLEWPAFEAKNVVIPELPQLRDLTLNQWSINKGGQEISAALLTKFVRNAPALEKLFVSVDKIDEDLLAAIASRPLIKELRIESRQCLASLAVLSRCDKLQDLYLQFPLRNEHLLELNQLQHLTELYLMDYENNTLDIKLLKQRESLKAQYNYDNVRDLLEDNENPSASK